MATNGAVKGPWSEDEDEKLLSYIRKYGHGHWDSLARKAGLKRTGKSCRLRWLNYLRPGIRRGNISLQEQLVILQLHSRWGNRWAKIAECLPGRSDNEIKNYWRTRVQKQAKQLQCDVNSNRFREIIHHVWMPQLAERLVQTQFGSSPTIMTNDKLSNQSKPALSQSDATDPSTAPSHDELQMHQRPSHGYNDSGEYVFDTLNMEAAFLGAGDVDGYTYAEASCKKRPSCEEYCPWRRQEGLEADKEQELATAAWFDHSLENLLNDEEMILSSQKLLLDDYQV